MYDYFRVASPILYEALIPPDVKARMAACAPEKSSKDELRIAIGARFNGAPIGIALIDVHKILKTAAFYGLYLLPEHRQEGVGESLMEKALEEIKNEGGNVCTFKYTQEDPDTPALEKILTATHWKGPRPFMLRARFDPYTFDTPWMHYNYHWPPGYEEFFWRELSDKERISVEEMEAQGRFPIALSPFHTPHKFEPMNSLGLRRNGSIVGWVITHRTDPDTVRYSSVFIDRSLRDRGLIMKLLADSLLLHARFPSKYALLEMPHQIVYPLWAHFIKKRLLPLAIDTTHLVEAWLPLNNH